jgi:hypothetical protein
MSEFRLQPDPEDLHRLAEEYWAAMSPSDRVIEKEAFEAGSRIRVAVRTLAVLEPIIRWKSPRMCTM